VLAAGRHAQALGDEGLPHARGAAEDDGVLCRTPRKGALSSFATRERQTEGQSGGFCRRERRRRKYTFCGDATSLSQDAILTTSQRI
jgi:hypothetical protein